MTRMVPATLALALTLAGAGAALAQTPPMTPQQEGLLRQSCSGDYMRLCATFSPGSPELEQCFRQRMNELSPRCRAAIADVSGGPQRRR